MAARFIRDKSDPLYAATSVLKPVKGSIVIFDGVRYVAVEVGVRYVRAYKQSDPRKELSMYKIDSLIMTAEKEALE